MKCESPWNFFLKLALIFNLRKLNLLDASKAKPFID
jgi:hypothetical protein